MSSLRELIKAEKAKRASSRNAAAESTKRRRQDVSVPVQHRQPQAVAQQIEEAQPLAAPITIDPPTTDGKSDPLPEVPEPQASAYEPPSVEATSDDSAMPTPLEPLKFVDEFEIVEPDPSLLKPESRSDTGRTDPSGMESQTTMNVKNDVRSMSDVDPPPVMDKRILNDTDLDELDAKQQLSTAYHSELQYEEEKLNARMEMEARLRQGGGEESGNTEAAIPAGFFDDPEQDARARGIDLKKKQQTEEKIDSEMKFVTSEVIRQTLTEGDEKKSMIEFEEDMEQQKIYKDHMRMLMSKYKSKSVARSNPPPRTVHTYTDIEMSDDEDEEVLLDWRMKKAI